MRLLDYATGEAIETLSYSVAEDANPLDISTIFGGVPSASVSIEDFGQAKSLGAVQVLLDDDLGAFSGEVRNISRTDGQVSITLDGAAYILNVERNAMPQRTSLANAMHYYVNTLMGQNNYLVQFHQGIDSGRQVNFPGWTGNVWAHIKEMLAIENLNITVLNIVSQPVIYITPLRLYELVEEDRTVDSLEINSENSSHKITIAYYVLETGNNIEVWPGNDEDAMTVSVNANEAQTYRIELQGSVSSVNQPEVTNWVPNEPADGTTGRYAISGSDGLPVTANQWIGQGGSLTVGLVNSTTIEVTIVGPDNKELSPYNVTMSAGSGSDYNALRITGNGMRWVRKEITFYTGAANATATDDPGMTIDSMYISDITEQGALTKAATAALGALGNYSGIRQTVSGSIVNTPGFGLLAGSRVYDDKVFYRIDIANTSSEGTDYTASNDTIVNDFDSVWQGKTIAEYDAHWEGRTMRDQFLETLDAT